jgi:hypothetical protein
MLNDIAKMTLAIPRSLSVMGVFDLFPKVVMACHLNLAQKGIQLLLAQITVTRFQSFLNHVCMSFFHVHEWKDNRK